MGAADRERLFEMAEGRLDAMSARGGEPWRCFVPGRIEVLGKHTDYAGGRSLLCAVERGFHVVARPRSDRLVRIADAVLGVEASLNLSEVQEAPKGGNWASYPAAVVRRIVRNFPGELRGADIAFASDLPLSAGLSSSSALVVAVFTALGEINALGKREEYLANIRGPEDLAGYLGAVENGLSFRSLAGDLGVGTFGGSEDHTAILCCRDGRLSQYSFLPVRREKEIALPRDWTFAVASSGVAAEKAGNARERYNRLSLATQAILDLWRAAGGGGATLGEAARMPDAPDAIRAALKTARHPRFAARELAERFEQFFEESELLLPVASEAFARGDGDTLRGVVSRSQAGAEKLLRNQIPETIALVTSALALEAIAASAFGAGFGGSVWALVPTGHAPAFLASWQAEYRKTFPAIAGAGRFFLTGAGPGLLRLG